MLLQNIFYRKQIEFKENSSFFSFFFQVVEKMVTMREIVLKAAEEEEGEAVEVVVVLAEVGVEGVAVDVLSVESPATFLEIVGSVNFVVVEFVRFIFSIKFRIVVFVAPYYLYSICMLQVNK